jgi:hypothetical protein
MPYITVGKENSGNIDLYYEDAELPGRNRFQPCWEQVTGSSPTTAEGLASQASRAKATTTTLLPRTCTSS